VLLRQAGRVKQLPLEFRVAGCADLGEQLLRQRLATQPTMEQFPTQTLHYCRMLSPRVRVHGPELIIAEHSRGNHPDAPVYTDVRGVARFRPRLHFWDVIMVEAR
jgi:hypothetical protein